MKRLFLISFGDSALSALKESNSAHQKQMFRLHEARLDAKNPTTLDRLVYYAELCVSGHLPEEVGLFAVHFYGSMLAKQKRGLHVLSYCELPNTEIIEVLRQVQGMAGGMKPLNDFISLLENATPLPGRSLTIYQRQIQAHIDKILEVGQGWIGDAGRAGECWN